LNVCQNGSLEVLRMADFTEGHALSGQGWSVGDCPVTDGFFVGDDNGNEAILEGVAVNEALAD
jgi:hypothetical protein